MRALSIALLLALSLAAPAPGAGPADRLDDFRDLARRYAEAPDPDAADALLADLFAIADREVIESLRSGRPFASPAFIQERLEAFAEAWGGVAFEVMPAAGAAATGLTIARFEVTRGEPRGSLRIYGGPQAPSLLAASTHDGALEVRRWPDAGSDQILASWIGPAGGRASRVLQLELWRRDGPAGVTRVWSSADVFPGGLRALDFAATDRQIRVRYEVTYPGWKPGCSGETEQEDVYRAAVRSNGVTLAHRRVLNGWHRELQSAVTRFFDALGAGDSRRVAELVPDASVRARLPRGLEPETVCDERGRGPSGPVLVAATLVGEHRRVPWSLWWRRGPGGWRLGAADPVLQ
jgi:hypothetical protein